MSILRQHTTQQLETVGLDKLPKIGEDRYFGVDLHKDFWFLHGLSGDMALSSVYKTSALMYGGVVVEGTDKQRISIEACGGFVYINTDIADETQAWQLPPITKQVQVRVPLHYNGISNYQMTGATLNGSAVNYVKLKYLETLNHTRNKSFFLGTFDSNTKQDCTLTVNTTAPTDDEIVLATLVGDGSSTLTITQRYPVKASRDEEIVSAAKTIGNISIDTVYYLDSTAGTIAFNMNSAGTHRKMVKVKLVHMSGANTVSVTNGSKIRYLTPGMYEEFLWTGTEWQVVDSDETFYKTTATDNVTVDLMEKRNYQVTFTRQTTNKTITLPDATLCRNKKIKVIVSGAGAGDVLLATASSQTIGAMAASVWTFKGVGSLEIQSDGSNWILGSNSECYDKYTSAGNQTVRRYTDGRMSVQGAQVSWGGGATQYQVAITFATQFQTGSFPVVKSIVSGTSNWIYDASNNITATGCNVVIRDTSNIPACSIGWRAEGYWYQ